MTTTEEDNFRDPLFEAVSSTVFPSAPFFCVAMFESTEKQREQVRFLVHFSQKGIFVYRLL